MATFVRFPLSAAALSPLRSPSPTTDSSPQYLAQEPSLKHVPTDSLLEVLDDAMYLSNCAEVALESSDEAEFTSSRSLDLIGGRRKRSSSTYSIQSPAMPHHLKKLKHVGLRYSIGEGLFFNDTSEVPMAEVVVNGYEVQRRLASPRKDYINATYVLKAANFDKCQRTKVLERECKLYCRHYKKQGGPQKRQGTWLPMEDAWEFTKKYVTNGALLAQLRPLFGKLPLPESAVSSLEKIESAYDHTNEANVPTLHECNPGQSDGVISPITGAGLHVAQTTKPRLRKSVSNVPQLTRRVDGDRILHPNGKKICEMIQGGCPIDGLSDVLLFDYPANLVSCWNALIDNSGHTVVHWAAGLGRAELLEHAIDHGADICIVNTEGQTALMRSVMSAHAAEIQSFPRIFECLFSLRFVVDSRGCNFLHHICEQICHENRLGSINYYIQIITARLKNGLNRLINQRNAENQSPLDLLRSSNKIETLLLLNTI